MRLGGRRRPENHGKSPPVEKLGLVDCDAEKLARISRTLEKREKQSVLVAIDGSCRLLGWCFWFHGISKMPSRQLQHASEAVRRAGALRARPPASDGLLKRYQCAKIKYEHFKLAVSQGNLIFEH